uniref:C2H2-type domain-containing protein n=1 Tax=Cyclopterus lumpus TaxID=8103 RepID=A0A8C2WTK1_CYCLU
MLADVEVFCKTCERCIVSKAPQPRVVAAWASLLAFRPLEVVAMDFTVLEPSSDGRGNPPHIKEEQEELWTSQEGEQLQGKLDPERHPGPDTDETDDSRDCEETEEPESYVNPQNKEVPVSDVNCSTGNTSISSPECAGSSDHKGHLEKPTSSKTGEKPFQCSLCDKRFGFNNALKRHMSVHTGEKPFQCDKPFSCSVCGKTFTQKRNLNNHMTVHTGEKPFSCSVCGKTFTQKRNLNNHMTVHTGEKPFSCSVCGKSFTRKQRMKQHLIEIFHLQQCFLFSLNSLLHGFSFTVETAVLFHN